MSKYRALVLVHADCPVTVEAETPEEAADLAHGKADTTLCHQCSDHVQMGDTYAVIVRDENGKEVFSNEPPSNSVLWKEVARLQDEVAQLKVELSRWSNSALRQRGENSRLTDELEAEQEAHEATRKVCREVAKAVVVEVNERLHPDEDVERPVDPLEELAAVLREAGGEK